MQKLVYDGLQRCPYLPGQVARMPLYRQMRPLRLEETDERLGNAERRAGTCLYRTACPTCRACEGLRVDVARFAPTRAQRRAEAAFEKAGGTISYGPAQYSDERLALFNLHKRARDLQDPEDGPMTALGYTSWLVQSCMHTMEMQYRLGERLIGVGIVDLGRVAASSVYFYFDPSPEISKLSPGVLSVVKEVALCRRTRRDWLYLGLYVADCRSLAYKAQYQPNERLVGGAWREALAK